MKVIHELSFDRRCPINDGFDHYDLVIETNRLITVEDILEAIDELPEKVFQEVITERLAARLKCRVTTTGHHSGVKTTCTA